MTVQALVTKEGIAPRAIIHPNVRLGRNVVIEDFCIIGYPPKGFASGELETVIGDNVTIRSHSIVYAGTTIGAGSNLSHQVMLREHSTFGERCSIGMNSLVEHHCKVGNNVRLQGQSGLAEYTTVEDDVWIGPRVVTANVYHPTCDRAKECLNGPTIRRGAIIGAQVFIAPNIEIGERAFVSAGSVVAKSVEDGAIVFGVPAKKIGVVEGMKCPFDLKDKSPYALKDVSDAAEMKVGENAPQPPVGKIPLMDLSAQYQTIKQDVRFAMDRVIFNNRFIGGKELEQFEADFARFCGANHAYGVSSGTSAIKLALRALEIGDGDEVITTPHTFIATAESIVAVGAKPVFVDVDDGTGNLDPELLERAITPRTKAIVPVHLYGRLADMDRIMAIARRHNLRVVEDAAQAHGAKLHGRQPASWGDVACFSFYPGKNLGAYGDAGGVVTNDSAIARRIVSLRDHGRSEKYLSAEIGYDARMDTLQAAVLGVKLRHLGKWNEARRRLGELYNSRLADLPIALPKPDVNYEDVYYVYAIRSPVREQLRKHLNDAGIATGIYYPVPLHLQPALKSLGHGVGSFPVAERWANEVLALPMFPELSEGAVEHVANQVRQFFTAS